MSTGGSRRPMKSMDCSRRRRQICAAFVAALLLAGSILTGSSLMDAGANRPTDNLHWRSTNLAPLAPSTPATTIPMERHSGPWVNATANLAELKSECGNLTLMRHGATWTDVSAGLPSAIGFTSKSMGINATTQLVG